MKNILPPPELPIAPARLGLFVGALLVLGILIIGLAVRSDAPLLARAVFAVLGVFLIWQADQRRRTKDLVLTLTEDGLMQSGGKLIAPWEQIIGIDRGALALKPSNGFTLLLRDRQSRDWVPGLWWRIGRRVGVGGVASAGAAKFMAEYIATKLAEERGSAKK